MIHKETRLISVCTNFPAIIVIIKVNAAVEEWSIILKGRKTGYNKYVTKVLWYRPAIQNM